jgi:hypothetical protein
MHFFKWRKASKLYENRAGRKVSNLVLYLCGFRFRHGWMLIDYATMQKLIAFTAKQIVLVDDISQLLSSKVCW